MTCDDCISVAQKRIQLTTRAERTAMLKHAGECRACYEWLQKEVDCNHGMRTPEQNAEILIKSFFLCLEDALDPESR